MKFYFIPTQGTILIGPDVVPAYMELIFYSVCRLPRVMLDSRVFENL